MTQEIKPGTTFSHTRECHKHQPIFYAGASGDFNPIHLDDEVGKAAGLGGVILQGLCTFAWLAETVTQFQGDPGKIRKVRTRFSRAVKIDDVIKFEATVTQVSDGRFTVDVRAKNQNGEDVLKGASVEAEL